MLTGPIKEAIAPLEGQKHGGQAAGNGTPSYGWSAWVAAKALADMKCIMNLPGVLTVGNLYFQKLLDIKMPAAVGPHIFSGGTVYKDRVYKMGKETGYQCIHFCFLSARFQWKMRRLHIVSLHPGKRFLAIGFDSQTHMEVENLLRFRMTTRE